MTEKCSLATVLHCTVLQITTFVCIVAIDNFYSHYYYWPFCTHHYSWQCLYALFSFYIFWMSHWKWHFWYAHLLNYWSCQPLNGYNKMFLWTILNDILCMHASLLQLTPFCMHCCTNFLIHYCNGNPLYIDNFYIAKLSPSPNPSSIGAEVVIFSFNPTTRPPTHPPDHPPGIVFFNSIKQHL